MCPVMNRRASVLWMPPNATRFASRAAFDGEVAYASQFETRTDRAYRGQAKIKARLIDDRDPDGWILPPKPKGMHWRTYNGLVERFNHYEEQIDDRSILRALRILKLI
jgi:hypothetical protein